MSSPLTLILKRITILKDIIYLYIIRLNRAKNIINARYNSNIYKRIQHSSGMDLSNWNPWWMQKEVPKVLVGFERLVNPLIFRSLYEKEITALTGIRRCGKSTIMYQMIASLLQTQKPSQICYVNLDDPALIDETLESIYSYYRSQKNPDEYAFVFFDEIQNKGGWERVLKKYYDLREKAKFVVSGSSASLLKGEYATLLTGRNLTFTIYPLSFKEYLRFASVRYEEGTVAMKNKILFELNNYLEYGGLPEVYFKDHELKRILLRQYFDDIIYKDIVKRYNVNAKKITDIAVYLLTNMSNSFTQSKIRKITGLSFDSIKEYMSHLEDAFLVSTVEHFSYSTKERFVRLKKIYSVDCGLRNIAGYRFSSDSGRLAENCVFGELIRRNKNIYYYRNKGEVDFIVRERDNSLTAVNVSFTDQINPREINSLLKFNAENKRVQKRIILSRDYESNQGNIKIIPVWKWLLEDNSAD